MHTYKVKSKKMFSLALISIIAFSLFACSEVEVSMDTEDNYVLNKRSLKIHAADCDAINLMSHRNKLEVKDTLNHLLGEGYIPCEKCKARKRKKFLGFFENPFREKEYIIDIEDLPSREEYLNAINVIGEWYINHVPTYQGQLELEKLSDYVGNDKYYKEYKLKSKQVKFKIFSSENSKDYISISTDSSAKSIDRLNVNTDILKAKEEAVINYKSNYKSIDIKSTQAYYPCEYIKNSSDSYKKAGDDCVRFFFTLMNSIDKDFTFRLSKIVSKTWSHIDTNIFYSNRNVIVKAMILNGFDVYDFQEGTIKNIDIKKINNNFKLSKGDVIVRKGHIHIYLGEEYGKADNFGWGKVSRIFPQNYNYYLETFNGEDYYIVCDHDVDNDNQYRQYTRVYHYKGGKLNEAVEE